MTRNQTVWTILKWMTVPEELDEKWAPNEDLRGNGRDHGPNFNHVDNASNRAI